MATQDLHTWSHFLLCKVCPKTILQILYISTLATLIKIPYSITGYKNVISTMFVVCVHNADVCEPLYHQDYTQFYIT